MAKKPLSEQIVVVTGASSDHTPRFDRSRRHIGYEAQPVPEVVRGTPRSR